MPLQNRVDPWGKLNAVSAKGALLGNRGILHNDNKEIVTQWRSKAWITCQIEFKGRESPAFAPDSYSQLFFVDEATAFAAGHRPCAECRRERFNEFKAAWMDANHDLLQGENPTIVDIDKVIHTERVSDEKLKRTYAEKLGSLPAGTMIEVDGSPLLVWRGKLMRWSFEGYSKSGVLLPSSTVVQVLTPASVVRVFASGLTPQVHLSAYN
jgi:hypothetical protein